MANAAQSALSRRQFIALGGGAASAALLASCTPTSDAGSGSAGPPQRGGTYTFAGIAGVNTNLDLHTTLDPATYLYIAPICSKLVEYRTGRDQSDSLEIVDDLAREWEVSEDGLTYTFHLRDNVTWQDVPPVNGRPFTSDDVLATYQAIIERPATQAWMFARVADIQAPDDHTVVIRMSRPYSPFLQFLANEYNVILPREQIENRFDRENMIIGTGPFMLETYERGEQMIRVRNPNYYQRGKPYLDEVNHVIIPEQNARVSAFLSGRIDGTGIPNEQLEQFRNMPDVDVRRASGFPVSFYLQTQRRPFTDLRVRRAVMMAINWEGMGETIYPGHWELSSVLPASAGEFALPAEEIRRVRPYDPQRARRLLEDAGYPNGFDTTMLVQELVPQDVDGAEYMIQDLGEVGINVELQLLDAATAVSRRVNGEYQMAKSLETVNLPDVYMRRFESGAQFNYARIADPQLDRMIEETRATFEHDPLVEQYRDITRYLETELAGATFGVQYSSEGASRTTTHNYYTNQYGSGKFWADVWVES